MPLRLPYNNQLIGLVESELGDARMNVKCVDGKTRLCRVQGKLRFRMWVKKGDFVIIRLWETEKDTRGDIIYKYSKLDIGALKKEGYLSNLTKNLE